jgi:antitoxin component of MazEF toxin-antitoxin module
MVSFYGKKLIVRKNGKSNIVGIPAEICNFFGIKEGSELKLEPHTTDFMILKITKK